MQTLRFVLQLALGIALPLGLQRWDRRRLSPDQRARCWNAATWGAALYAFGPLSMLGWCWVTRGAPRPAGSRGATTIAKAVGLGVVSAASLGAVMSALDYLVALVLGLPP